GTVADEQKFYLGALAHKARRDGKEIIVSLELEQPGDGSNDHIAGRKAKGGAKWSIVRTVKVGFEHEAAENSGVTFRPADTSGEVLLFHGFGDDDEVSGDFGRETFRAAKEDVDLRA